MGGFGFYPVPDGAWSAQLRISTVENFAGGLVGVDRTVKAPAAGKSLTVLGWRIFADMTEQDIIPFMCRLRLGVVPLASIATQGPRTGPPEAGQVGGHGGFDGPIRGALNASLIARLDTVSGAQIVPSDEESFIANFCAWGIEE
jgi:hypothetical protein